MRHNATPAALHRAIYGRTRSGKTFLAKMIAADCRRRGIRLAILDPLNDPGWPTGKGDFVTRHRDEFKHFIRTEQRRLIIIDESSAALDRYDPTDDWPATMGRHLGHLAIFIAQRPQQISPTVRGQCEKIYCFALAGKDARLLADEFGRPEILKCANYSAGEFQELSGFTDTRFGFVNFAQKTVTYRSSKNAA